MKRAALMMMIAISCRPFGAAPEIDVTDGGMDAKATFPSPRVEWKRDFGVMGAPYNLYVVPDTSPKIAADSAGNLYVAGTFGGDGDFGTGVRTARGRLDAFVMKIDGEGFARWSWQFGEADRSTAIGAIALNETGRSFVWGATAGGGAVRRSFLAALDVDGADRWTVDTTFDVSAMSAREDDLFAYGYPQNPAQSPVIAKYVSSTGEARSNVSLTHPAPQSFTGQAWIDADGTVSVAFYDETHGHLVQRRSATGELAAQGSVGGENDTLERMVRASDGSYFVQGTATTTSLDYGATTARWIHATDASFAPKWPRTIERKGLRDFVEIHRIHPDLDGGLLVAGLYRGTAVFVGHELPDAQLGTRRYFVSKIDAAGAIAWVTSFITEGEAGTVLGVVPDGRGKVFVALAAREGIDVGNGHEPTKALTILKLAP